MEIYTCKHFKINELVPYDYYEKYKDQEWKLWMMFDDRALITIDLIREFIDIPIIINSQNYHGSKFDLSGVRPENANTGAMFSQHKFGRAFDLKFYSDKWTPEKLRLYMKEIGCFNEGFRNNFNYSFLDLKDYNKKDRLIDYISNKLNIQTIEFIPFMFITRIEWAYYNNPNKEMSWFHLDIGNSISSKIEIIFT